MSTKIAKQIITLLCDDIRQEVGNKDSLMGVYHENVYLGEVPAFLQRLSFAAYISSLKLPLEQGEIFLTLPGDERKKIPVGGFPKSGVGTNVKFHLTFGHLEIRDTGPAIIEIILNNDKKLKIVHKFNIELRKK